MAEVKLSMEEYHNVVKSLNILIEKLYEMTKKCSDYKRQRDELINDMAEVKRKAEAYDKIKEVIKPNNQYHLFQIANAMVSKNELARDLKYMDQLDETHEFQNLLSDLEE